MFLHLLLLGSISPLLAEYETPNTTAIGDVPNLMNDDDDVPLAKNSTDDILKTFRSNNHTQPNRTAILHFLEYETPNTTAIGDVPNLMNDDDDVPLAKNSSDDILKTFRSNNHTQPNRTAILHFLEYETPNITAIGDVPNLMNDGEDVPLAKNSSDDILKRFRSNNHTQPNRTAILHFLGYNDSYLSSLNLPKDFDTMDVEELRRKYQTELIDDYNKFISEQDIHKYVARALPVPKPRPFWTIWKVLLIIKLVLALIYWVVRCTKEKEKIQEEENEKNGGNDLCKIP